MQVGIINLRLARCPRAVNHDNPAPLPSQVLDLLAHVRGVSVHEQQPPFLLGGSLRRPRRQVASQEHQDVFLAVRALRPDLKCQVASRRNLAQVAEASLGLGLEKQLERQGGTPRFVGFAGDHAHQRDAFPRACDILFQYDLLAPDSQRGLRLGAGLVHMKRFLVYAPR